MIRLLPRWLRPKAPAPNRDVIGRLYAHPAFLKPDYEWRRIELSPADLASWEREAERKWPDGRALWTFRIDPGPESIIVARRRGGKFECLPRQRMPLDACEGGR